MTTNRHPVRAAPEPKVTTGAYVLGGGPVGARVANRLAARGEPVTFVDSSPPSDLPGAGSAVDVEGLDRETLSVVGLADASTVVVLEPDDATTLLVAQLARSQFDVGRVVALVNDPTRAAAFENVDAETLDATAVLGDAVTGHL